jgi:oxygen-independent coproporphyrinogen-3 oxidase
MLEVDEDSRLGRELIAGGTKYHAHFVPDDDLTADFYETACERLNTAGIEQYEISNFARKGFESRHNLKYWTRQPYLGFGVDAHSMLPVSPHLRAEAPVDSVRFGTSDDYDLYLAGPLSPTKQDLSGRVSFVSTEQALEERFFLGLRLNQGVDLARLREEFGLAAGKFDARVARHIALGMLDNSGGRLRLTPRGRLLSNEVFESFIGIERSAVPTISEAG